MKDCTAMMMAADAQSVRRTPLANARRWPWPPLLLLMMMMATMLCDAPGFVGARPLTRLAPVGGGGGGGAGELEEDPLCTAEWNYSVCVPKYNKCGAGYQLAVRSGDLCRVLVQVVPCTAPCVESSDGAIHIGATHFDRAKRGPHHHRGDSKRREGGGAAATSSSSSSADKAHSPLSVATAAAVDGGVAAGSSHRARSSQTAAAAAAMVLPPSSSSGAAAVRTVDLGAHKEGSLYTIDGCTYRAGGWQACSIVSLSRLREDRLVSRRGATAATCVERKSVTMDCSLDEIDGRTEDNQTSGDCRYSYGKWSKCDDSTGTRVRRQVLLSGGTECQLEIETRKPCFDRSGKERCFYGRWSAWTPCVDGVRSRSRSVLHGGERCLEKSVKASYCSARR